MEDGPHNDPSSRLTVDLDRTLAPTLYQLSVWDDLGKNYLCVGGSSTATTFSVNVAPDNNQTRTYWVATSPTFRNGQLSSDTIDGVNLLDLVPGTTDDAEMVLVICGYAGATYSRGSSICDQALEYLAGETLAFDPESDQEGRADHRRRRPDLAHRRPFQTGDDDPPAGASDAAHGAAATRDHRASHARA